MMHGQKNIKKLYSFPLFGSLEVCYIFNESSAFVDKIIIVIIIM